MKQGGLWVCVSKTVCGFLGMHVYQKKNKKHDYEQKGEKTKHPLEQSSANNPRITQTGNKETMTRLRLRCPTTCQQCLRCRVCPAHRVRYPVTSVSSCRAATQWPGSWSVSVFCVDLVSSCDSHCAHQQSAEAPMGMAPFSSGDGPE